MARIESRKKRLIKYKALRADLAKHLPKLDVVDILALNGASVTILRVERETTAEADQEGGNHGS